MTKQVVETSIHKSNITLLVNTDD